MESIEDGPRYARIQKTLEERLMKGVYVPGSLLPTEVELATEFNTSRFTIREALRYLRESGYVERKQGIGTRVLSSSPQTNFVQSFSSLQELFQVALDTWLVVLDIQRVTLDAPTAELVGTAAGEQWFRVDCVRWTRPGGRPICYIQSYIPSRFEHVIPSLDGYQGAFFALLEADSGNRIEQVTQEIRAMMMPPHISRQLGLAPDAVALQLLRRYLTQSGVLIASCNWHPADQMTYVMNIERTRAGNE